MSVDNIRCKMCVYVHIGHEAVASEVSLGISTFKPSEYPTIVGVRVHSMSDNNIMCLM